MRKNRNATSEIFGMMVSEKIRLQVDENIRSGGVHERRHGDDPEAAQDHAEQEERDVKTVTARTKSLIYDFYKLLGIINNLLLTS